jgi:hypothetical protein
VALFPLRGVLPLTGGRLHQPGLDPELSQPQPLVGLQLDLRARQQRVVVAARVLEQVPGQLLLQRAFISLQPLTVLGREPDGVLVGHVDAGHGRRAMRIHLLGQLASELDGLHLRREGATEHPFNEVLDPLLEVSKNADPKAPYGGQAARMGLRAAAQCAP